MTATADLLATAKRAVDFAADALEQAERDAGRLNVDADIMRIDSLAAAKQRAERRVEFLTGRADAEEQAQRDRIAREAEMAPEINARAAKLAEAAEHLALAVSTATDALQAVARAAEAHDAHVIDARMALETANLYYLDDHPDCQTYPCPEGVQLNGRLRPHTPAWAAMMVAFTRGLSVLPFDHPIRREFDLHKRLEVIAVERSGVLDEQRERTGA